MLLSSLLYYLESLFTFLIALIPYGRRCPQLVKAKFLGNLYHQFSCTHSRNAFYPRRIFLEALQDIPISAISIDLQLPLSRLRNSQFWDLEHVLRCYHIFGKNCLPPILQLLWDVHTGFTTKGIAILLPTFTPRGDPTEKPLEQRTKTLVFGTYPAYM